MTEWQPISSAPKDGTRFIAWHEKRAEFFHWQGDDGSKRPVGWRDGFIYVYPEGDANGPTHWMPLPDAPPAPIEPEPERDTKTIDMFAESP